MKAEKYLALFAKQIHDRKAREEIVLEYFGHIEEYKEELIAGGIEEGEAERIAVEEMGDPVAVGRKMNRLYSSRFDWDMLLWTALLMVVVFVWHWFEQASGEFYIRSVPGVISLGIGAVFVTLGYIWTVVEKYNDFPLFYAYARNWKGGYLINSGVYLAVGVLFLAGSMKNVAIMVLPVLLISFVERFCMNMLRERKEAKYLWEMGNAQTYINRKGKACINGKSVKVKARNEEITADAIVVVTSFQGFVPVVEKI